MKIEIIAIPPGQAPDWVRKAWIGCIIPVDERRVVATAGALGGPAENYNGYDVSMEEALAALEKINPEAANWWRVTMPQVWGTRMPTGLCFKKEVCRII